MAKKSIIQKISEGISSKLKAKPTPEEIRRKAEADYYTQMRAFKRYDVELEKTIQTFKNMAVDCKNKGQESNALRAARFVRQLKHTHEKVISVRQHFEMLHVMGGVSNIMVQFMETCSSLGCDLSQQIDVSALGTSEISLAEGLDKIDFLSDKIEQAFETIEGHLNKISDDPLDVTAEDYQLLNTLMQEAGTPIAAEPQSVEAPAVSETAQQEAAIQAGKVAELKSRFEKLSS